MDKKVKYYALLSKTYDEVVQYLLEKYGPSDYDYFSEKSYKKFLNNEINSITKGKYSRTSEGLYCHHIDEYNHENLSNIDYIREFKYPFNLQKKDRLVYCDLLEHAILHALIAKETNLEFGLSGYQLCISKLIKDWYINTSSKPNFKREYNNKIYDRAYLNPEDALELLTNINNTIYD